MSSKGGILSEDDEQKIREAEPADIGGSEPSRTEGSLIENDTLVPQSEHQVPEEIVQEARRRSLANRIREDHQGEGFVIVNTESADIIETVDNLMEARRVLESTNLGPDQTLVVSCYER